MEADTAGGRGIAGDGAQVRHGGSLTPEAGPFFWLILHVLAHEVYLGMHIPTYKTSDRGYHPATVQKVFPATLDARTMG